MSGSLARTNAYTIYELNTTYINYHLISLLHYQKYWLLISYIKMQRDVWHTREDIGNHKFLVVQVFFYLYSFTGTFPHIFNHFFAIHILSRRISNLIFTPIQFANAPRQQDNIFFAFFFIFLPFAIFW